MIEEQELERLARRLGIGQETIEAHGVRVALHTGVTMALAERDMAIKGEHPQQEHLLHQIRESAKTGRAVFDQPYHDGDVERLDRLEDWLDAHIELIG